jgi:hypothetical protein
VTIIDQNHQTTFCAAEIDLGDGTPPRYVKGLVMDDVFSDGSRDRQVDRRV